MSSEFTFPIEPLSRLNINTTPKQKSRGKMRAQILGENHPLEYTFYIDWYMLLFYTVGTIFGLWVGHKTNTENAIERTIDYLIENKLVRWKENEDGEIELLEVED